MCDCVCVFHCGKVFVNRSYDIVLYSFHCHRRTALALLFDEWWIGCRFGAPKTDDSRQTGVSTNIYEDTASTLRMLWTSVTAFVCDFESSPFVAETDWSPPCPSPHRNIADIETLSEDVAIDRNVMYGFGSCIGQATGTYSAFYLGVQ